MQKPFGNERLLAFMETYDWLKLTLLTIINLF